MRFLQRIVLVTALLLGGCVNAPLEESRWIRVESEHFQVISGASRSETVEIAERLELLRAVLKRLGLEAQLEPRIPLLVYVFPDSESFGRFRPRLGYSSFLLPRTDRYYLAVQGGTGDAAKTGALHEYVHFVLRNRASSQYPAWYDEGLAEFLSTVFQQGDRVAIGTIPLARKEWLLYGSPMSVRAVMTARDTYEWSPQSLHRYYAQAWALTHFFHVADRVGFTSRHAQLLEYIARRNRGEDADEACRAAFGTDFEGLEKEFMLYLAKGELPYLGISAKRLKISQEPRTVALSEAKRRYLLGDLAIALGPKWRDEAEYWFRLAVRAAPDSARAQAALGRVSADRATADAHLRRFRELGSRDAEAQRQFAEARLAQATAEDTAGRTGLIEESREAFRRSIEIDPEQVAAYDGLGRTYVAAPELGDAAEGLAALSTAHERLATNPSIALSLAELELAQGRTKAARAILALIPTPTHGDPLAAKEHVTIAENRVAAGLPAQPMPSSEHMHARLDVEMPREGEKVRGLSGWVVARGQGGLWDSAQQDVIIAIDESPSSFLPTGTDLDGDGEIGKRRLFNPLGERHASTDPGDTIIRAELQAARALIRQLDPLTTRVGIVTFAKESAMLAPIGPPDAALRWLDGYDTHLHSDRTSLAAALDGSLDAFFEYRENDARRQRTILLLSDGEPTHPSVLLGRLEALKAADRLGEIGIPVQAFALGPEALEEHDFYRDLAERSGGKFIPVRNPADVVSALASVTFTGLEEIAIHSSPIDQPGRAVRVFPNGSFDGYVPLAEGKNVITITGVMENGKTLTEERIVHYERPANPSPADRAAADKLRRNLQDRKVEIELLAEMRRAGPPQMRQLKIEVTDSDDELQDRQLKVEVVDPPDEPTPTASPQITDE